MRRTLEKEEMIVNSIKLCLNMLERNEESVRAWQIIVDLEWK